MKAEELKQFTVEELKTRIHQWKDELCRFRFKTQNSESRDTSVLRKLRKDIARGNTVLTEKVRSGNLKTEAPHDQIVAAETVHKGGE